MKKYGLKDGTMKESDLTRALNNGIYLENLK